MGSQRLVFPDGLADGSRSGARFGNRSVTGDNPWTYRATNWDPHSSGGIHYPLKSDLDAEELGELIDFYHATRGSGYGFRFKDFNDFTTALNGSLPLNPGIFTNRSLCTAVFAAGGLPPYFPNGVNKIWKFNKVYYNQGTAPVGRSNIRRITKPTFPGDPDYAMVIYLNGFPAHINGIDQRPNAVRFAVDYDGGVFSMTDGNGNALPPSTALVEALFTFHVPARFSLGVDRQLSIEYLGDDHFRANNLSMEEIVDPPYCGPEEVVHGGQETINANQGAEDQGLYKRINVAAQGSVLPLPPWDTYPKPPVGGPIMTVHNTGGQVLRMTMSGRQVGTVGAGQAAEIHYIIDGPGVLVR